MSKGQIRVQTTNSGGTPGVWGGEALILGRSIVAIQAVGVSEKDTKIYLSSGHSLSAAMPLDEVSKKWAESLENTGE